MTPSSSPVTNDIDTDTSLLQDASYRRVGHDPDLMAIPLPMYSTPGLSVSSPSGSLYDFVLVADTTDPSSVLPRPSTSFRAIRKKDANGKVTRYSMYPEQPDYAFYKRFPVEVRAVTPDGYACFADTILGVKNTMRFFCETLSVSVLGATLPAELKQLCEETCALNFAAIEDNYKLALEEKASRRFVRDGEDSSALLEQHLNRY